MKKRNVWIVPLAISAAVCLCAGITACNEGEPPAHEHNFGTDNLCAGCGDAWNYTEGLEYTLNSDGTYSVSAPETASGGVVIPYGYEGIAVTSVGEYAFSHCPEVTSVTLPNSITAIDGKAFFGCIGLTGIVIPDSVTYLGERAFEQCTNLTDAVIGDGVRRIDYYAFGNCTALTSVTLGGGVAAIGSYAFFGCGGLAEITVASVNPTYRSEGNCIIERAANKLVLGCKTSVIPSGVTAIGYQAFYGCPGLTDVVIPNGVTLIDDWAFSGCSGLASVVIPNSVTSIGSSAFSGCTALTGIAIPSGVTSIGSWAFQGCSELTGIDVASGNAVYRSEGDCLIERATNTLILGCKTSVIPSSVTSVGDDAFYGCTELTTIVIPNGVTSIGAHAFNGCSALTSIVVDGSVTAISEEAFRGCSGLETVYYKGTAQDWGRIAIGEYENTCFIGAARYYYSETPDYDGRHWHYGADGASPVVWREGE